MRTKRLCERLDREKEQESEERRMLKRASWLLRVLADLAGPRYHSTRLALELADQIEAADNE